MLTGKGFRRGNRVRAMGTRTPKGQCANSARALAGRVRRQDSPWPKSIKRSKSETTLDDAIAYDRHWPHDFGSDERHAVA